MKERGISFIEMIWEKESGKVTNINIKYGEKENRLDRNGIMTERNGRKMRFSTINEAVNHVKKKGWVDVRSFIQCFSGKAVYHFIFKK